MLARCMSHKIAKLAGRTAGTGHGHHRGCLNNKYLPKGQQHCQVCTVGLHQAPMHQMQIKAGTQGCSRSHSDQQTTSCGAVRTEWHTETIFFLSGIDARGITKCANCKLQAACKNGDSSLKKPKLAACQSLNTMQSHCRKKHACLSAVNNGYKGISARCQVPSVCQTVDDLTSKISKHLRLRPTYAWS